MEQCLVELCSVVTSCNCSVPRSNGAKVLNGKSVCSSCAGARSRSHVARVARAPPVCEIFLAVGFLDCACHEYKKKTDEEKRTCWPDVYVQNTVKK